MKTTKCPVCSKGYIKQGLRNHILNTAKAEAFRHLFTMLQYAKNKPYQFSPIVLLRQTHHLSYLMKNYKQSKKRELNI